MHGLKADMLGYRLVFFFGAVLYPLFFLVEAGGTGPRLAAAAVCLVCFGVSFRRGTTFAQIYRLFLLCAAAVLAASLANLLRSGLAPRPLMAFQCIVVALTLCFRTLKSYGVFAAYVLAAVAVTTLASPGETTFVFALLTTSMLAAGLVLQLRGRAQRTGLARIVQAVDSTSDGLVVLDAEGAIVYENPALKALTGWRWREVLDERGEPAALFAADPRLAAAFAELLATGRGFNAEGKIRRADGSLMRANLRGDAVRGDDGQSAGAVLALSDVQAKHSAAAASKMAALGEMAGGVAHEINNPLTIIKGRTKLLQQLALRGAFDDPEVMESLTSIDRTVARIVRIVKGLRAFSRNGDAEPVQAVELAATVEDTVAMCAERFKICGIAVDVVGLRPGMVALGRTAQLGQVLLNLLSNALDALEGSEDAWVRVEVSDLGGMLEIAVADSGPGVPDEVRERMFQPFYTTKDVGHGTGLGLSISRGLIEDVGGTLTYDEESETTRFVVRLPSALPMARAG